LVGAKIDSDAASVRGSTSRATRLNGLNELLGAEELFILFFRHENFDTKALLKYNRFIYEGALREKSASERSDKCRMRPN